MAESRGLNMCDWCEENDGESLGCQSCGTMICWDVKVGEGDDIISRPFVTSSGDVYCTGCGIEMERAEQESMEEEAAFYPDFED
jgi:hypothetical protein